MRHSGLFVVLMLFVLSLSAQTGAEFKKAGNEAYNLKNYQKAFLDYSRAIEAFEAEGTTDTALYYNATYCGYKSKEYEKLIPFATKTVELGHEKAPLACYIKAVAYQKLGKDDMYAESLKKGYEMFPKDKRIRKKIAVVYLKEGLNPYNEAAKIIADAEPFRESDVDKYKAELEKANAKFEEAKNIFEKAYEITPKSEQLLKALMAVYQGLEMEDNAKKIEGEINAL